MKTSILSMLYICNDCLQIMLSQLSSALSALQLISFGSNSSNVPVFISPHCLKIGERKKLHSWGQRYGFNYLNYHSIWHMILLCWMNEWKYLLYVNQHKPIWLSLKKENSECFKEHSWFVQTHRKLKLKHSPSKLLSAAQTLNVQELTATILNTCGIV